jgi:signal peptidase I
MRWGGGLAAVLMLAAMPLQALAQGEARAATGGAQDFSWMFGEGRAVGIRTVISGSMTPALQVGDRVAVFTLERAAKRGDVLLFHHPKFKDATPYVKRVVGLPGDTVKLEAGRLVVNGVMVERSAPRELTYYERGWLRGFHVTEYTEQLPGEDAPHVIHEFSDEERYDATQEFRVPEGHLFMMGDNRDFSQDSRALSGHAPHERVRVEGRHYTAADMPEKQSTPAIGFVPVEMIMGRVRTVVQSVSPCEKSKAEAEGAECLAPSINKRL